MKRIQNRSFFYCLLRRNIIGYFCMIPKQIYLPELEFKKSERFFLCPVNHLLCNGNFFFLIHPQLITFRINQTARRRFRSIPQRKHVPSGSGRPLKTAAFNTVHNNKRKLRKNCSEKYNSAGNRGKTLAVFFFP